MTPVPEPLKKGALLVDVEGEDFAFTKRFTHDGRQYEVTAVIPPSDRPRRVRVVLGTDPPDSPAAALLRKPDLGLPPAAAVSEEAA